MAPASAEGVASAPAAAPTPAKEEGAPWLCCCGAVTAGAAVCRMKKCRKGRRKYGVPKAEVPGGALRVVEFYSGMGGMHQALKRAGIPAVVVAAYDVNEHANAVYAANFTSPVFTLDLLRVGPGEMEYHAADLWTMSPPCQPYTRQGERQGADDHRSDSFFTLLDVLQTIAKKPTYILIENVFGFEKSTSHTKLCGVLDELGYEHHTALLNSLDFGVPNSRPRTYIVARAGAGTPPTAAPLASITAPKTPPATVAQALALDGGVYTAPDAGEYTMTDARLAKALAHYDVCGRDCRRSACFTKAYGRHAKGAGSLLIQTGTEAAYIELKEAVLKAGRVRDGGAAGSPPSFAAFALRMFTPDEIKQLLGFPAEFKFPAGLSTIGRYKILGNSLSVVVVAFLMRALMGGRAGTDGGGGEPEAKKRKVQ